MRSSRGLLLFACTAQPDMFPTGICHLQHTHGTIDTSQHKGGSQVTDYAVYVSDSPIHGKGLFADTFIPAGAVIGTLSGKYTTRDGDYVLWLDSQQGFLVRGDLRYINHSDAPNAVYYDTLEVCALRDIHRHEEITHDYGATTV
jgi:hypothetical protein